MQEAIRKNWINSSLLKTITSSDVEELCMNITDCLEQYYHFDGVGFFLLDPKSTRTYFHSDVVPKKFVQRLEEILPKFNQDEKIVNDILYFAKEQDDLVVFNPQEHPEPIEPMGAAFPLINREHVMGTLVLVAPPATIKDLTLQTPALPSFVPVISGLVANALDHENKDKKIHMLNLYQTVSSSISYIGDLQELLTTIASIVTSEILCEECSVLFYDSENNEFEFYTAVGETGMHLVKQRFPADKGIAGRALKERITQVVNDVQSDPDFYGTIDEDHNFKTKSILAAPLIAGDEPVGVLNAINKIETKFFDINDDQILSAIADEVALAVKNARLFEYVVDSYCKIRQGKNSCKGCKRPLRSWTPCVKYLDQG
ncbi:MAG: GAF domain-containing protein [Desulfobacterales bacterium]